MVKELDEMLLEKYGDKGIGKRNILLDLINGQKCEFSFCPTKGWINKGGF